MMASQHDRFSGATGYLNRMLNRSMDSVVLFDETGRIIFANAAFGRIVGQEPARLIRHSFLALVREAERPTVLRLWRGLAAGREGTYRVHLRTAGGDERSVVVVQHALGEGGLYLAYLRDLAESAELSRQIHELQGLAGIAGAFADLAEPHQMIGHLVRELAHLMAVERCFINLHDPATDWVEPRAPAHGIDDADLPRWRFRLADSGHFALVADSRQPRISNDVEHDSLFNRELARDVGVRTILTVPLTNGARLLGFINAINRFNGGFSQDDARPLQIFAVQVAVALENARLLGELAAEKDLALDRAGRLQALVDSMVDGAFIADADGRIVQVNTAALAMTGLDQPTALRAGDDYLALLALRGRDGRPLAAAALPWRRALAGETVRHEQIILRPLHAAADSVISVSGAPVQTADGSIRLAVVVARDITPLQEAQRQRDEFLAVASHELRTPLTSIRGFTQQVLRALERGDAFDRERAAASLNLVLRQVDRLARLSDALVDVSRLQTHQLTISPGRCDLVAITTDMLDRLAPTLDPQRHQVILRAPAEPVVGQWDAGRLAQVIGNLVANAVKFSPGGGRVEIRIEHGEDYASLSVRDEGIGIAPDQRARLFEPFHRGGARADHHSIGLGIGLHIAHEIVRLHGGAIAVESEPGRGSLFTIRLPLTAGAGVPRGQAPALAG